MTRFSEIAAALDRHLEAARPRLEAERVVIEDRSNRSGFDKTGFPYFLWSVHFTRSQPQGYEVAAARVQLSYLEPEEGGPHEVRKVWSAEIFSIGQISRARLQGEERLALEEALLVDWADLLLETLSVAEGGLSSALLSPTRSAP